MKKRFALTAAIVGLITFFLITVSFATTPAISLLLDTTSLKFVSDVTANKAEVPVGSTDDLYITLAINNSDEIPDDILLYKVDKNGTVLSQLGTLLDDGQTANSGDDVQGDRVYTCTIDLDGLNLSSTAGKIYIKAVYGSHTATGLLRVYSLPTTAEIEYTEQVADDVTSLWATLAPSSKTKSAAEYKSAFLEAQQQLVDHLDQDPKNIFAVRGADSVIFLNEGMPFVMAQATIPDETAWESALDGADRSKAPIVGKSKLPTFKTSTDSTQTRPKAVTAADNLINNNAALFIDPYYWQHLTSTAMDDPGGGWDVITKATTPKLSPTTEVKNGTALNTEDPNLTADTILDAFTTLSNYGTIVIHTHGGLFYLNQNWLTRLENALVGMEEGNTKTLIEELIEEHQDLRDDEAVTGTNVILSTDTYLDETDLQNSVINHDYASDILLGRLYVMTDGKLLVTPSFVDAHNGTFPNSVVWLGACHSLENNTLSDVLIEKGAGAVFGYDQSVYRSWNVARAGDAFSSMLSEGATAQEAFDEAIADGNDDGHGTALVLAGNGDLKYSTGLQNPSFEEPDGAGSLESWAISGDARAWKAFQADSPTAGETMAVVSSGLGQTTEYGGFSQTFQVPANANKLNFDWNFYSAEFKDYCNSSYDDTFAVFVNDTVIFTASVNTLCANENALIAVQDIDNNGDTFKTGWEKASVDISTYAGQNVTLKIEVTDKGDTVFDTAVLVDNITITTN